MGGDIFGVLLTIVLLAANAFFVGSEFALISARRDRLEALAEQGNKRAVAVMRAGEQLSLMLAGAPVPRLMLHAARLVFPHPEGGERRIEAPLPDDFRAVLEKLDLALPER
jgi:hypothetical protein